MSTAGKPAEATGHRWKFFRAGGFDQASLETGADLGALESLDQKLWVALSCPVSGIEFDRKDHAADETRYAVMSRPAPSIHRPRKIVIPGTIGWEVKRILDKQRRKSLLGAESVRHR